MSNRIVTDDNFVEQMQTANYWLAQIAAGSRKNVDDFRIVKRDVQSGAGATLYPVGMQFTLKHSVYGDIVMDVVSHDTVKKYGDERAHTMTLMAHDCIANLQFDAAEAMYYAATELAAGTYNFTVGSAYSSWAAGTYQFTLTQAVPAGGQLCISGGEYTALSSLKVQSYASASSTDVIESVAITSGSAGTSRGTTGAELNHVSRVASGSNNYKESAMRQFLNSDAAAGSVWTAQTKFDRPPAWAADTAGFLNGCPADFLDAIAPAVVKCSANNTYECPESMGGTVTKNTAYELTDKIFLASETEVGLYTGSAVADGSTLFQFYEGAGNADRIKYFDDSAKNWRLRTPMGIVSYIRYVTTVGGVNQYIVSTANGFAPCCIIA